MSDLTIAGDEVASVLLDLEARYGSKKRLAQVLRRNAASNPPAWERTELQPLREEVARLNRELLEIDRDGLRALCRRVAPDGTEAPYLHDLFFGTRGILELARRESDFFDSRRALTDECAGDPHRLAADMAADLLDDVVRFRRALHELKLCARAPLEVRSLGFGEMSHPVTLARRTNPLARPLAVPPVVFKRMAPFADAAMAAEYVCKYEEYNRRLRDEVGLAIPDFWSRTTTDRLGRTVVYCLQARLDSEALAKSLLKKRDAAQCRILFHLVLDEYRKLIRYNRRDASFQIGADGQIPNWVVRDYRGPDVPLRGDEGLWFIDTNTPMMRVSGRECLPLSFYLRGLPRLIRPFIRPLATSVLDRYFNPRTILLDFLANVSIHGRSDLTDGLLPDANDFLAEGLIEPRPTAITQADVERYIRKDVATWRLLRSSYQVEAMLERRQGPVTTFRNVRDIYRRPLFEE
jgi:hypothetical protein